MISRRAFVVAGSAGAVALSGTALAQLAPVPRLAIVEPVLTIAQLIDAGLSRVPVLPIEALAPDQAAWRTFFDELQRLGWIEGSTIVVERWSAAGVTDVEGRARIIEAVRASAPDVIVTWGETFAPQLAQAIATIPIVVQVTDPILLGVVANVARPEGNVTGIMTRPGGDAALVGRLIQLLIEMVPTARRVAWVGVARDMTDPRLAAARGAVIAALAARGVEVVSVISDPPSFDPVVHEAWMRRLGAELSAGGFDGVHFGNFPEFILGGRRDLWAGLLLEARLPSITNSSAYVRANPGALMSYSSVAAPLYARRAWCVDQILKGTPIVEMPFFGPSEWQLTINQRTAEALGITIPLQLLAVAGEIIGP